jgi:hypothetical protein
MIQPIAIAAMLLAPAAAPAKLPCAERAGVRDATMMLAPHIIEAVAGKCRAHLPATAFLASRSSELVARMKTESAGRADSAAAAIRVIAGEKLPEIKDNDALMTVGGQLGGGMIAENLKPEMCPEMSNLIESFAPLPSENLGRALVSVLALAKVGEKGRGPAICPNG